MSHYLFLLPFSSFQDPRRIEASMLVSSLWSMWLTSDNHHEKDAERGKKITVLHCTLCCRLTYRLKRKIFYYFSALTSVRRHKYYDWATLSRLLTASAIDFLIHFFFQKGSSAKLRILEYYNRYHTCTDGLCQSIATFTPPEIFF